MKKRNRLVAILLSVMLTVGSMAGTVSAAEAVAVPGAGDEQLLVQEVSREETADVVSGDEAAVEDESATTQGATDGAANEAATSEESTGGAANEAAASEESTGGAANEAAASEGATGGAANEASTSEETSDDEASIEDEASPAEASTDEAADETETAEKAAAAAAAQQPSEAQSQQDQSEQPQEEPDEIVLIEYNGIEILTAKPATQSATPLAKSGQICQTLSEALDYVRGQMIARQENISVTVPEDVLNALDLTYYEDLTAHTGNPRGGDYLRSALTYMGAGYAYAGDEMYQVGYYFGYKTDAQQEAATDAEVTRLKSALGLGSGSAKTDYEKVKAIHDYLVENVEYDYDTAYGVTTDYPGTYTGYGAIVNHLAVCQGFAAAFYRLCLEAGIDARLIDSNEMCHAWNIVQLDGLYYLMDCTWDENIQSDDYFLRGKYDFEDHANSDDQFSDSAFASKYPLSDYKYGFTIHSLGTAPDYTLITQDRRTVSTAAQNGRAKVLIFFLDGCGNFLYTMETLRGKEYAGVDFVYANMTYYTTQEQQDMLAQIGNEMPDDVPGTYAICANGNDARDKFEDICGLDDGSGYIYSASVFLISPDNEILYAENAYAGEIGKLVGQILEDADLPEAPAPGEDPYAGFTAIGLCGKNAVWRFYGESGGGSGATSGGANGGGSGAASGGASGGGSGDGSGAASGTASGGAYGKGSLLITGSGALWDSWDGYSSYTPFGWLAAGQSEDYSLSNENIQASEVKKLIVDAGITRIGSGDLKDFTSLQSITFKGSAPAIDSGHGLTRNIRIYFPEDDASWNNVDKSLFSSGCKWISQDANGVHHHKWGSWTVTKPATMAEEGTKERTCTECKEKETETIPKIDGVLPGKTTRGDLYNLANSVKVTWNAVPGAKYYKVYREGITNPKESIAEPVIVTTKLVGGDNKPGLVNGHAYRYRIVASLTGAGDPSGDSPLSYSKLMYRLQTTAWKYVKNTAPGKVTASYKKSPSGDGYVLLYADNQDMVGAKSKVILGADTTAVVLGGFTKGKTYWFQIRVRKKVNGVAYYTTFGTKKAVKITQ